MNSIGIYVKLRILMYSGLVLPAASLSRPNERQCFDVGEKDICYFRPNVSSVDWDTAWKICRDLKSTLPVIPDKEVQAVLSKYISSDYSIESVWTAGRYTGDNEWKWVNGQTFRGKDKPTCTHNGLSCNHATQAVLSEQLRYETRFPANKLPYICNFTGSSCTREANYSSRWEAGCLKWDENDRLYLNEARNQCVERGGDLATFSEQDDFQSPHKLLPSHIMFNKYHTPYWIGLHRKWWIWNATDVQDIKYNLLKVYGNDKRDCLVITTRSYEWVKDFCARKNNVICQKVSYPKEMTSTMPYPTEDSLTTNVIIGSVIAVLTVAIIFVVLLVLIKKRGNVAEVKPDAGSLTNIVTKQQITAIQCPDDTYATIDLDDDLDNLNYEDGPNPSTLHTKVEICDGASAVYSEPTDIPSSETNRSTAVYSEPYGSSSVTPVYKNLDGLSRDIYSEVNNPGQQKKSDELTSPPIKIGPNGDIYTLPISHN